MDNSDLDWAGGGIEEVLPDVEEVGALPPHPHWGGSTPRPLLAAHSTTRREKGFRTSTPSACGRKTGGRCSLRSQRLSGGVCYQYIYFPHFSTAKIRSFFEHTKFFRKKMQDGGAYVINTLIEHFSLWSNFGILKYKNIYSKIWQFPRKVVSLSPETLKE